VPGEELPATSPALLAPLTDAQWRRLVAQAGLTLREARRDPAGGAVRYVAERAAA
jgi:hypothetical protein